MLSTKDLSKRINKSLDVIGFHHEIIQERISFYKKLSRGHDLSIKTNLKNENIDEVFTGSKTEGIGMEYLSDTDILRINQSVICCNTNSCRIAGNDRVTFEMEQKGVPEGYTYLKLTSKGTDCETYESLKYALVDRKKGTYLSSKLFMTKEDRFLIKGSFLYKMIRFKKTHGPSNPSYIGHMFFNENLRSLNLTDQGTDFVRAFPCEAYTFLDAWKNRDRKCGWPNQGTIAHVMSLPVHVVPVGQKGSINEDLQWRLSFTMAEIHLVKAFNNAQAKVLVLMKFIAKHILKPLCRDISSYVVKTIMLWLAEHIPQKAFCKENLLIRLIDALAILKIAIEDENLPGYMLPQRNLLENKITEKEQQLLMRKLKVLKVCGIGLVDELYFDGGSYYRKILKVSFKCFYANLVTSLFIVAFSCNTSEDLASFGTALYASKSKQEMENYAVAFVTASFYLEYCRKGRIFQNLKTKKSKGKKLQNVHY